MRLRNKRKSGGAWADGSSYMRWRRRKMGESKRGSNWPPKARKKREKKPKATSSHKRRGFIVRGPKMKPHERAELDEVLGELRKGKLRSHPLFAGSGRRRGKGILKTLGKVGKIVGHNLWGLAKTAIPFGSKIPF